MTKVLKLTWVSKTIAIGAVLLLTAMIAQSTPGEDEEEKYRAFAVNMSNIGMGGAATLDITISRWSTPEERQMLHATLVEKGHDAFVKALRKQKETGWTRATGRAAAAMRQGFPSTRTHYAWQYEENGTRHIIVATNRPIGFREAASASRSVDYNISFLTLEFPAAQGDEKPKGKGQLYFALKVSLDKDTKKIKVEEAGTEPIRLTTVSREK